MNICYTGFLKFFRSTIKPSFWLLDPVVHLPVLAEAMVAAVAVAGDTDAVSLEYGFASTS